MSSLGEQPQAQTQQKSARQQWMSVLAKAPSTQLITLSQPLIESHGLDEKQQGSVSLKIIRAPEIGLAQVRGRTGGTGSAFNVGDVTMTRCVVQFKEKIYGHSYVLGRDKQHALIAAKLDALLQDSSCYQSTYEQVVEPLSALINQQQSAKRAASEETKVDFFTLVRGED